MKDILIGIVLAIHLPLLVLCLCAGFFVRLVVGAAVRGWRLGEKISDWVHS